MKIKTNKPLKSTGQARQLLIRLIPRPLIIVLTLGILNISYGHHEDGYTSGPTPPTIPQPPLKPNSIVKLTKNIVKTDNWGYNYYTFKYHQVNAALIPMVWHSGSPSKRFEISSSEGIEVHGNALIPMDPDARTTHFLNFDSAGSWYGLPSVSGYGKRKRTRALTIDFPTWSAHDTDAPQWATSKFAFSYNDKDWRPRDVLDVNGGIILSNARQPAGSIASGTIQYNNGQFSGFDGSQWVHFGAQPSFTFSNTIEADQGIQLGNTSETRLGMLRYSTDGFEGFNGSEWLSFTEDSKIMINQIGNDSGLLNEYSSYNDWLALDLRPPAPFSSGNSHTHMVSFGSAYLSNSLVFVQGSSPDDTPQSFIVSSKFAPQEVRDDFPNDGQIYSDDEDMAGGLTFVTGGDPSVTMTSSGNTFIHNNLAVGLGSLVPGTSMTVSGAVHIGPNDMLPGTFDYTAAMANHLLWVERGIVSEKYSIAPVNNWSDHVFDENYNLMPLADVASHIESNGHLPGIPSEQEVMENGYSIHEMTCLLLEKIEELTLHTIEQQKILNRQEKQIRKLTSVNHRRNRYGR